MHLLICAGGTGGGVNPALAVLNALSSETADPALDPGQAVEALWVGARGGMESTLVERAGIAFKTIPASGVHGVGLKALPGNLARLVRGAFASRRILKTFKPDVLFFTGGYVAVPMAVAGWRVPTMLYVPDIEPGLALKTLARFADRIVVSAQETSRYFKHPERVIPTGYPTRPELSKWNRAAGYKALELSPDVPVLLVAGGSKGAQTINKPVLNNLPALLELVQVIHITGELDWPASEAQSRQLSREQATRYHAFPYLHEKMGAALAAADLAVSRAGASTLGEYPLFGLPAILVPYPYAWRYQRVNAEYLVKHGAATMIENENLSDQLVPAVKDLLNDPGKLSSMRDAMRRLSHPGAAVEIGRLLRAMAEKRSRDHG